MAAKGKITVTDPASEPTGTPVDLAALSVEAMAALKAGDFNGVRNLIAKGERANPGHVIVVGEHRLTWVNLRSLVAKAESKAQAAQQPAPVAEAAPEQPAVPVPPVASEPTPAPVASVDTPAPVASVDTPAPVASVDTPASDRQPYPKKGTDPRDVRHLIDTAEWKGGNLVLGSLRRDEFTAVAEVVRSLGGRYAGAPVSAFVFDAGDGRARVLAWMDSEDTPASEPTPAPVAEAAPVTPASEPTPAPVAGLALPTGPVSVANLTLPTGLDDVTRQALNAMWSAIVFTFAGQAAPVTPAPAPVAAPVTPAPAPVAAPVTPASEPTGAPVVLSFTLAQWATGMDTYGKACDKLSDALKARGMGATVKRVATSGTDRRRFTVTVDAANADAVRAIVAATVTLESLAVAA